MILNEITLEQKATKDNIVEDKISTSVNRNVQGMSVFEQAVPQMEECAVFSQQRSYKSWSMVRGYTNILVHEHIHTHAAIL